MGKEFAHTSEESGVMTPRPERKADATYIAVDGAPDLELNTKTGVYYVRKRRAGKRPLFKSTRSKKKGEAKTVAEDMIADWLGNRHQGRRVRVERVAAEMLAEFKDLHGSLDKDGRPLRRKSTFKHDQAFVKFITTYFGENYIDEIDEQFWEDWVKGTGRKLDRTLADVAKYLSMLMTYAVKKKMIMRKPQIKNPDKFKSKAVVYSDDQILEFIKHADPMLKDMIVLAGENPLRPNEVRQLNWGFLTFQKNGPVILRLPGWFTKTELDRELELSANASKMLARRLKANRKPKSLYVFPSPGRPEMPISDVTFSIKWRQMIKAAGLPKSYKFHYLRHSVYTKLIYDAGLPIQHVSAAGGTSVPVLMRRYPKATHVHTRLVSQAISLKLEKDEEE